MEAEDKEFFILVLGVLAAILVVISWWFTAGSTGFGATATKPTTGTAVDNGDNEQPMTLMRRTVIIMSPTKTTVPTLTMQTLTVMHP